MDIAVDTMAPSKNKTHDSFFFHIQHHIHEKPRVKVGMLEMVRKSQYAVRLYDAVALRRRGDSARLVCEPRDDE